MPIVYIAAAALLAWALQSLALMPQEQLAPFARADTEATSFLTYHQAVAAWVAEHGSSTAVSPAGLTFPPGYVLRPDWQHQVVDGALYSYTDAGYAQPPGFADAVASVGRRACLRTADGTPRAHCADGLRTLPAAVASQVAPGAVLIVGGGA